MVSSILRTKHEEFIMTIQTHKSMDTHTNMATTPYQNVMTMLAKLPVEYIMLIEQFVRLLHQHVQRQSESESISATGMTYPLVTVPAESLGMWMNLLPDGYEGNALHDAESLYDEVI